MADFLSAHLPAATPGWGKTGLRNSLYGDPTPGPELIVSNIEEESNDRFDTPKIAQKTLTRATSYLHAHTPRSADKALSLYVLSRRTSLSVSWLQYLFDTDQYVRQTPDGHYWRQLPWDDTSTEPVLTVPASGSVLSERNEPEAKGIDSIYALRITDITPPASMAVTPASDGGIPAPA